MKNKLIAGLSAVAFAAAIFSGPTEAGSNSKTNLSTEQIKHKKRSRARKNQVTEATTERVVRQLKNGYLNDPKVSVEVLNYRPFFITGEIKNGGEYPYKAGLTVQDAVAVAGGYSYRAETSIAYIRRAGTDKEVKVSLNSRVTINPGDIVRIPERFF